MLCRPLRYTEIYILYHSPWGHHFRTTPFKNVTALPSLMHVVLQRMAMLYYSLGFAVPWSTLVGTLLIPNQCSACMDHSIDWQRLTTSQQYDSVEVEVWGVEPSICLQVHPRCWMKTASHCSCSINMSLVSSLCLQCGVLALSCSIVAAMKTHWHFIEAHMACLMKTDSYRYTVLKRKLMLCFNGAASMHIGCSHMCRAAAWHLAGAACHQN